MLATDLRSEEAAIRLYRDIQAKLDDENLKIMVERIIADEERHATEFRRAIQTYAANGNQPLPIDVCYCPFTDEPSALYCGPEQSPRPRLNPMYARTLLVDLGGANGHYTESTQYYYQAFVTEDDTWLRNNLLRIAMDENHHIHQTQLVIRWLGMDPLYVGSDCRFWQAGLLDYSRDPAKFLPRDIALEESRIAALQAHLAATGESFVARQLSDMLEEEQRHLRIFREAADYYQVRPDLEK